MNYQNVAVIGAGGTLGTAFIQAMAGHYPDVHIHAFARTRPILNMENVTEYEMDYFNEESLKHHADRASKNMLFDLVFVATGILHDTEFMPEKSLRDLSVDAFTHFFRVNTILPAMVAKYFIPCMAKDKRSIFTALSARVGSISDNRLGGWYAYRASKSALNMLIKNISLETKRTHPHAIIAGLHPGTVNSPLSVPFQKNIPQDKIFTPEYSAECLLNVINGLTINDSGKCFGWDTEEILP